MRTVDRTNEADTQGDSTVLDDDEPPSLKVPPTFTRGLNPRGAMSWVRQTYGSDGERKVLDALPPSVVALLGGARLNPAKLAWVPLPAHAMLLETIDRVFGAGDFGLLPTVGRYMAFRDVPLIARPIAMVLRPASFIDAGLRIWRFYHSHGSWLITKRETSCSATLYGMPYANVAFCQAMRGWAEGALLFTGAREVMSEELRCQARGATSCAYELRWREK
jgi:hypothetical protein